MIQRELTFYFLFLLVSVAMISCEKQGELRAFIRTEKTINLPQFKEALKTIPKDKKDYLAFWHSMLTGNTRSLSKDYKEKYKSLGLSHVFTPSGFHLSALLTPVKAILPLRFIPYILMIVCLLTFQLPGQDALKRMSIVKVAQSYLGQQNGFRLAMFMTLMMGQLNSSPLSFIFSCFFLGIIFSGLRGIALVIWFFLGQMVITFLTGGHVSLLNLILSPIANFFLTLITPFLFLLSFPLGDLQLKTGLAILEVFDLVMTTFYQIITNLSQFEVHSWTITLLIFLLWRRFKLFVIGLLLFSSSLNLSNERPFKNHRIYFTPAEPSYKMKMAKNGEIITYYREGKCWENLRMGIWEKRCSPKRAPKRKSIKKLSYL